MYTHTHIKTLVLHLIFNTLLGLEKRDEPAPLPPIGKFRLQQTAHIIGTSIYLLFTWGAV